ncbi:hypothetical protein D1006_00880 [Burkholderia stabilis]|uniref:Uncharacterized protein n=1 Tax=Burkholderia stabilis TaxID=95485 RepID=A0A4Q2ANP4_9BURK|nr:tail fiber protein [Burkholderia stabilis]RXV71067.1 hypothetical protein D1006_00880 [Burkholderia stabilis]
MPQEITIYVDNLPAGAIIMWNGDIAFIPNGWVLCDGSNGTPNLRDRFIVGAGGSYAKSATGGSNFVALTTDQLAKHNHGGVHSIYSTEKYGDHLARSSQGWKDAGGRDVACFAGSDPAYVNIRDDGKGESHENRPPYYALYFIMKK